MQKSPQASPFQQSETGRVAELLSSSLEVTSQAQKLAQEWAKMCKNIETVTCERNKAQDDLKSTVLRCERDVAEIKQEMSKAELERLQDTKDVLENLSNAFNSSLAQEREKIQTTLGSAIKNSKLIQKSYTTDASVEDKIKTNNNSCKTQLVNKNNKETETVAQDLVSIRAEQEHFVKLQHEMYEKEKLVHSQKQQITKMKHTVQQLKNNLSTQINEKRLVNTQLDYMQDGYRKTRANLEASNAEKRKLIQQLNKVRINDELLKKEVTTGKMKFTENEKKIKELQQCILEQLKKYEGLEKQNVQLRKIATKYKKQAVEGTEDDATVSAPSEKIKELEDNTLKNQLDEKTKELDSQTKSKSGDEFTMTLRQHKLHKQTPSTSKPATSGATADKVNNIPLTTNTKPMTASVAEAVASPRLQVSDTQFVAPYIKLETHSVGIVSSTVTLPQATMTSTPTVLASAHLTTSTSSTSTTKLMATVSPTTTTTAAADASQQQIPPTSQSGEQASCYAQASSSFSMAAAGHSPKESGIKRPFESSSSEVDLDLDKKQMRTR